MDLKSLAFREPFWSLFEVNFFWLCKNLCGNFLRSRKKTFRKTSLFVEFFLWKSFLFVENFHDCWKIPWLWKNKEFSEIRNCGKLTFFTAEKIIGRIILKANTNVETIKTYILYLEQELSSLTFFMVGKVNTIFSRRLKHKYQTFMCDSNKSLFTLNQIYSQKL